jgi:hypothetical protein
MITGCSAPPSMPWGPEPSAGAARLARVWIATGTLLGALLPALGMAVIAAFVPYYWLPIRGEITSAKPRHGGGRP